MKKENENDRVDKGCNKDEVKRKNKGHHNKLKFNCAQLKSAICYNHLFVTTNEFKLQFKSS